MKLYVGNLTDQNHKFIYRVESVPGRPVETPIGAGQQACVYNNDRPDVDQKAEIDAVLKQHVPYGIVEASSIDLKKGFAGLCYSIDKIIDVEKLLRGMKANEDARVKTALTQRKDAVQALAAALQEESGGGLRSLTVETIEQPRAVGVDPEMGAEQITLQAAPTRAGRPRTQR